MVEIEGLSSPAEVINMVKFIDGVSEHLNRQNKTG